MGVEHFEQFYVKHGTKGERVGWVGRVDFWELQLHGYLEKVQDFFRNDGKIFKKMLEKYIVKGRSNFLQKV